MKTLESVYRLQLLKKKKKEVSRSGIEPRSVG